MLEFYGKTNWITSNSPLDEHGSYNVTCEVYVHQGLGSGVNILKDDISFGTY